MAKKILWLSRHAMTAEQKADLCRIYGSDIEVKAVSATVKTAAEIIKFGEDCDVLAVVLPPALLAELVNPQINQKPVIRARANRVPTGKKNSAGEDEFQFVHAGWEHILKIDIVTRAL